MQTIIQEQQIHDRVWAGIQQHINTSRRQRLMRAIAEVWPLLPQTFNGNQLALAVMRHAKIHDVYYDTIFRYMRELRDDGTLDYIVINKQKSQYQKAA